MKLEMIEKESAIEEKAKAFNAKSKATAHFLGNNLSLIICLLLPAMFIFTIWTKPTLNASLSIIGDFFMTVIIFLAGQAAALNVGIEGGKLDDDYLRARDTYREIRQQVLTAGISKLQIFCDKEIEAELIHAKITICRKLRITSEDMEKYCALSFDKLAEVKGKAFALRFEQIRKLEPIELTEDILLNEGRENSQRGGLGKGAEEHLEGLWKGKKGLANILFSVLTIIFSVAIGFIMTDGVSFALVVYTIYKTVILLFRMANSYRAGAKAYNTYEAQYLENKAKYLIKYLEFLKGAVENEGEAVYEKPVRGNLYTGGIDGQAEIHCEAQTI